MLSTIVLVLAVTVAPAQAAGASGESAGAGPVVAGPRVPASPDVRAPDLVTTSSALGSAGVAGRFRPVAPGADPAAGTREPAGALPATGTIPAIRSVRVVGAMAADSPVRRRPRAVVYSDWYARRLAVHRIASYATLPLFAAQYYTGSQLMAKGADAPVWVIRSHAPLATAMAVLFATNTVTGLWNLWDSRKDPAGRTARTAHGLLMLAADAGFLITGAMGHPAVQDGSIRTLHRTVALSSVGVALIGYAIMLPPFRR